MKVLLKQDIERVGRMGEVVEVAGGFARNFLIPRGLAVGVTRGRLKEIEEQRKVLEVKATRQREQLQAVAERITSRPVVIKARCSASGKLFGSITNRQLAQAIADATGEEVDRHKINLDDRIRAVGTYHAIVKLHPDVQVDLEFQVEGEGFVAEEPEDLEAEAATEAAVEPPVAEEVHREAGMAEAEHAAATDTEQEAGAGPE